jgi:hypothetical protein
MPAAVMNGIEPSSTVLRADSCSATADVNTLAESWKRQGLSTPVPLHEQPCQRFLFSQDCQTSTYTDGQEIQNGGKIESARPYRLPLVANLLANLYEEPARLSPPPMRVPSCPTIFAPNLFMDF